MMRYLDHDHDWLVAHGAIHTAREIAQQPRLWREITATLQASAADWQPWLNDLLATPNLRVVMTGAGTSAFAGKTLAPVLRERTGLRIDPVATTDIVGDPQAWLDPRLPTLLVSFARSGNSPESVAAVELADQLLPDCRHLILTCNPDGALARYAAGNPRVRCVLMPDGANDQSFAMTSSFTSMFVSAALMLGAVPLADAAARVESVAALCEAKLALWPQRARQLAIDGFERVVYLGSNGLAGLAEEASLKLLELTAGRIATRFDSPLGVRHGPKFMIDARTCVLVFMSSKPYTRRYDDDLYAELVGNGIAPQVIALGTGAGDTLQVELADADDLWLALPYLLFAQLFAFEASLAAGLTPDNPCPTGEVNRVVQGVTIYPYPN
ncbi:SIS domain-containing protein [Jeongeupia chitinilytica]|uniref:Tagatose-6-phosphate ketose isomerase n=1 Tax=Jeongeupia chitinilytica TaxID=1041641 RepID=A0ABQ3H3N0_9NEIS|nr:SIS domain-containing protein [Jeongeupia chitinilytica]GHD65855.1 tagatose-6-phosphate ketose isomerase [Jeongeupia chitinilytica]